jgi:hypothetical protein
VGFSRYDELPGDRREREERELCSAEERAERRAKEDAEDRLNAQRGTVPEPIYLGRARNGRERLDEDPLDGLDRYLRDQADSHTWELYISVKAELERRRRTQAEIIVDLRRMLDQWA